MEWRHNGTAWMTNVIMKEWLRWFDKQMSDREVVLLMDNFSAHELAVENIKKAGGLQNTRIIWLPERSTSLHQPLDQGIIKNFKAYYRKYWLEYMLDETEQGKDPLKTMNILKAIQFACKAWRLDVQPQTIANCWRKSEITGPIHGPLPRPIDYNEHEPEPEPELEKDDSEKEIEQLFACLVKSGITREDCLSISSFIDPIEEAVFDPQDEVVEHIAAQFNKGQDAESDEEREPLSKITIREATNALTILRQYEEQADDGSKDWITSLNQYEKVIQSRRFRALRQQSIESYF